MGREFTVDASYESRDVGGYVGFGAAVEDLEELGNFVDRRRRIMHFGTQRIHKSEGR